MVNRVDDFLLFRFFLQYLCKKSYILRANLLNILIFNSKNVLFLGTTHCIYMENIFGMWIAALNS